MFFSLVDIILYLKDLFSYIIPEAHLYKIKVIKYMSFFITTFYFFKIRRFIKMS